MIFDISRFITDSYFIMTTIVLLASSEKIAKVDVKVDVTASVEEVDARSGQSGAFKLSPGPDFVKADAAFCKAVMAEIKRRQPPKTSAGKLYRKFKKWNQTRRELKDVRLVIERGVKNRSFLMLETGHVASMEKFTYGTSNPFEAMRAVNANSCPRIRLDVGRS